MMEITIWHTENPFVYFKSGIQVKLEQETDDLENTFDINPVKYTWGLSYRLSCRVIAT